VSVFLFACPEYYSKQHRNEQYTSLLLKKKKKRKSKQMNEFIDKT
jgi:hypothetical protein